MKNDAAQARNLICQRCRENGAAREAVNRHPFWVHPGESRHRGDPVQYHPVDYFLVIHISGNLGAPVPGQRNGQARIAKLSRELLGRREESVSPFSSPAMAVEKNHQGKRTIAWRADEITLGPSSLALVKKLPSPSRRGVGELLKGKNRQSGAAVNENGQHRDKSGS